MLEDYRLSRSRRKIARKGTKRKETVNYNRSGSREKTPEVETSRKVGSFRRQGVCGSKTRRQLVYTNQLSADDAIDQSRKEASMESILGHGELRIRQMSGTLSDHSQNSSNREVTFIKSDDQTKVADERMVFISYSKIPFSISSTIPYNKHSKVSRY